MTLAPYDPVVEPEPITRTEARKRATRRRLLESAYDLMRVSGVDAVSIQEITDRADVGFGTFYNYFESKDDIASRVLDYLIDHLGRRNDALSAALGETDTVRIVANSVRFVARELTTNVVLTWWTDRIDLLTDRMRVGFRPYAVRDLATAVDQGTYDLVDDDLDFSWHQQTWIIAGGCADIVHGRRPAVDERRIAQAVLRFMGVDDDAAVAATAHDVPEPPELPLDFGAVLASGDDTV